MSGNEASGAAVDGRMVSVYMERASGRFRLWATDLQEFRKKRSAVDDLHIKIIYKQYVSVGYNVGTEMPNAFVETRTMETAPTTLTDDGTLLLAYDYVLASDRREDHVLVDVFVYDGNGKEIIITRISTCPFIAIERPLLRGRF